MSSTKRKFKYKLSGFEQMWNEIERLEEREMILITTLNNMRDIHNGKLDEDSDRLFQACLDELHKFPGKSAGFKMIESMGLDFYKKAKDQFGD